MKINMKYLKKKLKNITKVSILFSVPIVLVMIVLIISNIYEINYCNNSYGFQIVSVILTSEIFIYLITVIALGEHYRLVLYFFNNKTPLYFRTILISNADP